MHRRATRGFEHGSGAAGFVRVASGPTLRVATDANPLWQSFDWIARVASPFSAYPAEVDLRRHRGDPSAEAILRLAWVHEVANGFEEQAGVAFPIHRMREVYRPRAPHFHR